MTRLANEMQQLNISRNSAAPRIAPVAEGTHRPLWSVMIPTFNCAHFLGETLQSVLRQNYPAEQMQIEVVDDCSQRDDPEKVVREVGKGRVSFYRQPKNLGHTGNFLTCLDRARGQLVHNLHGDDLVRDGFYAKLQRGFREHPEAGAAYCRHIYANPAGHWMHLSGLEMSEPGLLQNGAYRLAIKQRIQTPSIVVRRKAYEELGGFDRRLDWTEDWEMWVRVASNYPVWYEPEPLAIYRVHETSNTSRMVLTGENIRDARRCIDIFKEYFPVEVRPELVATARHEWAEHAVETAWQLSALGEKRAVVAQLCEALKSSRRFNILARVARVFTSKVLLGRTGHKPGNDRPPEPRVAAETRA